MTIENIAQVAHEINKAFCESIGDTGQVDWDKAPDWQKKSSIEGVNFLLENPDADHGALHENWMKQKRSEGWIYGPEKNEAKRTHPSYLPYAQLSVSERSKDYLFMQVVKSLKSHLSK